MPASRAGNESVLPVSIHSHMSMMTRKAEMKQGRNVEVVQASVIQFEPWKKVKTLVNLIKTFLFFYFGKKKIEKKKKIVKTGHLIQQRSLNHAFLGL